MSRAGNEKKAKTIFIGFNPNDEKSKTSIEEDEDKNLCSTSKYFEKTKFLQWSSDKRVHGEFKIRFNEIEIFLHKRETVSIYFYDFGGENNTQLMGDCNIRLNKKTRRLKTKNFRKQLGLKETLLIIELLSDVIELNLDWTKQYFY